MPDAAPPTIDQLRAGLTEVLGSPVEVLGRQANSYASTFASERVTCRRGSEPEIHLFCKHSGGYTPSDGHHGGVGYEATVYRRVLSQARVSLPTFHGSFSHHGGETLVIEHVDDATRLSRAPAAATMPRAARWIGTLHRHFESALDRAEARCLNVYDLEYFRRWASRAHAFTKPLAGRYPWLTPLCDAFANEHAACLTDHPTVIHGEFYPHNVLVRQGTVLPVDWESAAIASGEIDLATLTENWPPDVADACARAYRQARWPGGDRPGFGPRMAAARLYLHLRWLGDRQEWTLSPEYRWRFERLGVLARRLGIG